jgi:hypothetical protein
MEADTELGKGSENCGHFIEFFLEFVYYATTLERTVVAGEPSCQIKIIIVAVPLPVSCATLA